MQDYYQQNVFGDDYPNVTLQLSFVGTLCLVFSFGMGPFTQILSSYIGASAVMVLGSLLMGVGTIIAGFSYQMWHLYLTQGVCFGMGMSCLYVCTMSIAPQYFNKRRGLAMGIIASGSGIGGLIVPFIMNPINQKLGAGWTYRVVGFICLACNLVACAFVKDRYPNRIIGLKNISKIIQFNVLKDVAYCLWCLGACLEVMGYFIPFFYLPSYSTFLGLSDSQGTSLVAVASAMNFVGRIVSGFLADRIGPINTNILYAILSGLSSFLVWNFANSFGTLMAFSVIFGFFCGSYSALVSNITLSILGMERLTTGFSVVVMFNCIAVFSPNIASAIEESLNPIPFSTYKSFTGVAFVLGAMVVFAAKLHMNRSVFAKL